MTTPAQDAAHMARALRLAEQATLAARPNPRVGCVIVDAENRVIGEGATQACGGAHAEVMALRAAGARARGATAYVTLEPCHHQGRTGPCSTALLEAGVARVLCALADPHPVAGGGLAALAEQGVATELGLLADSAAALNPGFLRRARGGAPWVRLKMAASQDGRTALGDGRSQWITSTAARQDGQRWRARSCAVITGSGTVLDDDPQLTQRIDPDGPQPLRVVVDRRGRVPASARVFHGAGEALHLSGPQWRPDAVLRELAQRQCNEVLLEAGATLSAAWLEAGVVDELILYQSASLLGPGRDLLALPGLPGLDQRWWLDVSERRQFGPDSRIIARPRRNTGSRQPT